MTHDDEPIEDWIARLHARRRRKRQGLELWQLTVLAITFLVLATWVMFGIAVAVRAWQAGYFDNLGGPRTHQR